ncbi:4-hydroxythreonine-4-phosphate dehydrogenase PdxA [candidate division WOR-1 bacterium RIFOXYB2_FULL_48_7]|uniref:4-hydroxythreonine-4-phosphate dehydrogenase n=1 Tax=candidate division WOR-1 bacterium RIFOXYB2_FULL_48_7 TaxID=1802583 RepID=A0A1F4TLM7_UNCSA|nr:MAG: 4-hydroxythreonine-4-phosphate dehydrogenase PdxA [candidate division WOR-1 bacterium RIFOXYB2_FULL_48_7]
MTKPLIAITMGDPAGIGPEICAKVFASGEARKYARTLVIGDRRALRQAMKTAKIRNLEINPISSPAEGQFLPNSIDLIDLNNADPNKIPMGKVNRLAGKAAMEYLEKGIALAQAKAISALVTAPISKEAIRLAGYHYQGHTELLAARTKAKEYAMMFVSDRLWIMLATIHVPLQRVPKLLNRKKLVQLLKLAHKTLTHLRGTAPRIAVAGLNPHAGENGLFGQEEKKIIAPAVAEAKKLGINVTGPLSPDAVFNLANSGLYDLVLAMYHDQGLIPLKLIAFNKAVNVTVGLPIIRTSVDHGTGFDIAGKGWANAASLAEAIKVAADFSRQA